MSAPFKGGSLMPPFTEEERSANYEAHREQILASIGARNPQRTRSAILHLMGAWSEGVMAKAEVMELLDQHEANLRRTWEHVEMGRAQARAEDAIRGAVRAAIEGKLI